MSIGVALAGAAGIVVGYALGRSSHSRVEARGEGSKRAEGSVTAAAAEAVLAPDAVLTRGASHAGTSSTLHAGAAATPPPAETAEAIVEAKPPPDADALAKQLVDDVRRETRHAVWARQMESTIRETLQPFVATDAGVSVESVTCASVRCAVEGQAPSRSVAEEMASLIPKVPGMPRARIRFSKRADGTYEYRAVLARDGFNVTGVPTRAASQPAGTLQAGG